MPFGSEQARRNLSKAMKRTEKSLTEIQRLVRKFAAGRVREDDYSPMEALLVGNNTREQIRAYITGERELKAERFTIEVRLSGIYVSDLNKIITPKVPESLADIINMADGFKAMGTFKYAGLLFVVEDQKTKEVGRWFKPFIGGPEAKEILARSAFATTHFETEETDA